MHLRVAATLLITCALVAGCATRPAPAPAVAIAPDPFGYQPRSAVCTVSPVVTGPQGRSVSLSVRSDDGRCAIAVSQQDGTAYASFLMQTTPSHGKAFIYNYNNQTLIDYTASTAYAGPDNFTVSLIPPGGGRRESLQVTASVDATGVSRPVAIVPYVAPPVKGTTRHSTHRTTHHKKTTSSTS